MLLSYPIRHGLFGPVTGQIIQTGGATTVAVGGAIAAPGAITAGALAIPIAGAVAAVGLIIYAWASRRNAQKVATTQVVDEAEPLLDQNVRAFLSLSEPTSTDQAAALQYFDAVWGQVVKECRAIGGGAGERCIAERQEGANPPWEVCAPDCPNWFELYRDPIEQATVSQPSLASVLGLPSLGGQGSPVFGLLGAGLLAWAVAS